MIAFNEFDRLRTVAVRRPTEAFRDAAKIESEWRRLRYHRRPDRDAARAEHENLVNILEATGCEVITLAAGDDLTLDAIYTRDATLVSPAGLIRCRMGRESRNGEPRLNADALEAIGYTVLGAIESPGRLEGGDFIWINHQAAAVGLGPRTNREGIRQLAALLGKDVDLHMVPLPPPEHPEDVFHLMSMISPLDQDLAVIFRPLMPKPFLTWLAAHGIGFVEAPGEEFPTMACNVLALEPRHVLMLEGAPQTRRRLEAAGCRVETYPGDHISRMGEGGPTCLTRPLVRG